MELQKRTSVRVSLRTLGGASGGAHAKVIAFFSERLVTRLLSFLSLYGTSVFTLVCSFVGDVELHKKPMA
jgi:hypothetical protein